MQERRTQTPLLVLSVAALVVAIVTLALVAILAGRPGTPAYPSERNLSVTGTGSAFLTPDIVVVTLGVQTQGANVGDTVAANNDAADLVIHAVTSLGVAPEDVQTTYFSVSTQPKYDEFGNPTNEVTYWVDNTVTVTLRDISKLGSLLQTALASGANSVQGVNYTVDNPEAALSGARSDAMADARRQAEQLAAGSGLTLGDVISVSESTNGMPLFSAPSAGKGGAAAGSVPTVPGTLEYQVQIFVTFGLR
jgi:uncharacterized protein YggE